MSIKEWVMSLGNSLSGWDDRSLIVCPLFEIKYEKNGKENKRKRKYEVSWNGYDSLAMLQKLKILHCESGTSLMLLYCKGILRDPQVIKIKNKNDLKHKAYIFIFLLMLNLKRKWGMNFVKGM